MTRRPAQRALPVGAAALAGAVLGHWLTYVVAVRDVGVRDALLAATGHGYWPAAAAAAIVLGSFAAARVFVRRFSFGRAACEPTDPREGRARLACHLVLIQVAIYIAQETLERLAVGSPIAALAQDQLLQLGILIQVLVAVASALLYSWLGRAAEAVGRAFRRRLLVRPATFRLRTTGLLLPRLKPGLRINAIRAPPSLARSF